MIEETESWAPESEDTWYKAVCIHKSEFYAIANMARGNTFRAYVHHATAPDFKRIEKGSRVLLRLTVARKEYGRARWEALECRFYQPEIEGAPESAEEKV